MATFSIVFGSVAWSSGCSRTLVIAGSFLDTAARLGDAADLGGELGGTFGEELVELFDRDARLLAERADRGRGAGREVALAHELDDQPVTLAQLCDSVLARDLLGEPLVPLLRVGEEAFGVDDDAGVGDHRCGHLVLLSSRGPGRASCRGSASPARGRGSPVPAAARASRPTGTSICRGG